ncbi:hypothetical protein AMECASPLE_039670 [Ameca splendens]|uniref:Uncharacterized protein n=1 Tax=Ameca splendens TaxID=208324 RepID=A0ABV0YW66_9TELE
MRKMDRFLIKKGHKTDGESHSVVKNTEDNDSEDEEDEIQHEDDAGEGTSRQVHIHNKKRKVRRIQDEHRKCQDKWTDEFLFVLHGKNPLGLICKQTRAGFKRSNLEL